MDETPDATRPNMVQEQATLKAIFPIVERFKNQELMGVRTLASWGQQYGVAYDLGANSDRLHKEEEEEKMFEELERDLREDMEHIMKMRAAAKEMLKRALEYARRT